MAGFYNVTAMVNSLPVFISNAQFKDTPASTMANRVEVVWKQREPDFYDTFFDVEPIRLTHIISHNIISLLRVVMYLMNIMNLYNSGAGFHASSSSQLNIQIGPLTGMPTMDNETAGVTWFENMPTLYMPLFWAKQEAGIVA